MKNLKTLLRSGLFIAAFLTFAGIAHATDYTVTTLDDSLGDETCDSTCTFSEAVDAASTDGAGPNNVFFADELNGTITNYDPFLDFTTTAEFTIFATNDITIEGAGGNPVLFGLTSNVGDITIDGINFKNGVVAISTGETSNVTIQNCVFEKTSQNLLARESTLNVGGNVTVQDNEFINTNNAIAAAGGVTIQRNTITDSYGDIVINVTGISQVYDNTITTQNDYSSSSISGVIAIDLAGDENGEINVTGNEIYSTDSNEDNGRVIGISISDPSTNTATINISDNKLLPSGGGSLSECIVSTNASDLNIERNICRSSDEGIQFIGMIDPAVIRDVLIDHNTLYNYDSNIVLSPGSGGITSSNVTITNNILYGEREHGTIRDEASTTNLVSDYNFIGCPAHEELGDVSGEHDLCSNPGISSLTDFTLFPFSTAIGNDSEGGTVGAIQYEDDRRTIIYVDDDGEIDHETEGSIVDFNDIQSAIDMTTDGDTVTVAGGTYEIGHKIEIDEKSITLIGSTDPEDPSIIDATDNLFGLELISTENSTISNFIIRNAGISGLFPTVHSYVYNSQTYDTIVYGNEHTEEEGIYIIANNSDPSTGVLILSENNHIDSECPTCASNWHLALGHMTPGDTTIYFPVYFVASEFIDEEAAEMWADDVGVVIDYWYLNAFTYNEETNLFTFDTNLTNGTGVSLKEGSQLPIVLTSFGSGVTINDSSNNTLSNLTIEDNSFGFHIIGASLTNTILDIIFNNNTLCNVYSEVDGGNLVNGTVVGIDFCNDQDSPPDDSDVTAPVGLTALSYSARTSSSVTLNWSAVTEANFDHYEIWYGTDSAAVSARTASEWDNSDDANLSTISTTTTTITGLSSSTQYYFKIWAIDTSGNEETVATLSVTTSSNGGGGGVVTTPDPTPTDTDDDVDDVIDPITDIADTVVTVTETVRDEQITEQENEQNAQEATELISNLISEILTADALNNITDSNPTTDASSQYSPEDLSILLNPSGDIDGDGISNADEITAGSDPLKNNNGTIKQLFATPSEDKGIHSSVGALKILGVGNEGFVLSGTSSPNSEIEISMTNSKGLKVTLKTTTDINGNYILPVSVVDGLLDGSLLIKATNEDGKKDVILAEFKESTLKKPTLAFEGEKVIQYEDLTLRELIALIKASQEYKTSWAKDLNLHQLSSLLGSSIEKKIAFTLEKTDLKSIEGGKIIVKGKATPGSTVVLAYKSVIYSSIVIADKNGNFTAELPKDLQTELAKDPNATDALHEFIVFAMDYKKNEASAFNKGQFKLLK